MIVIRGVDQTSSLLLLEKPNKSRTMVIWPSQSL
jgi:hypothetical protein